MIFLLLAVVIVNLIPIFQLQVEMSQRVDFLSRIDQSLIEYNELISAECQKIQLLNQQLQVLETECLANVDNPLLAETLRIEGLRISTEQELLFKNLEIQAKPQTSFIYHKIFSAEQRVTRACGIPGPMTWKNSLLASYGSESGATRNRSTPHCDWEFKDLRVLPL